jgi:DNA-binding CsgD family transcriptional regulator
MMSRSGERCVGVICAYFKEALPSPPAGVETLDLYAEVAGSTIERHQLVEQLAGQNLAWGAVANSQATVLHWAYAQLSELERNATLRRPEDIAREAQAIASRIGTVLHMPDLAESFPITETPLSDPNRLSGRELDVLVNLWRGLSEKETAAELSISRFTVAKHLGAAMRKLNVESIDQAQVLVGNDHAPGRGHDMEFSDLLRLFRRRAGLTQSELAQRAGLSHRTISDLERGVRRKAYISTVDMLSAALNLKESDSLRMAEAVDRSRSVRRGSGPAWDVERDL